MEKQIIFTAFEKDNLIDQLLKKFKAQDWDINQINSIYHHYHWPTFFLSEEKPKFTIFSTIEQSIQTDEVDSDEVDSDNFNSSIDFLGQYFPIEEEIKLYLLAIEETAIKYAKYKDIDDIKGIVEQITQIALIHEISHWLVISVKDANGNSFYNDVKKEQLRYKKPEEINFHEGLAEYFTWYILQKNEVDLTLFDWLNKTAPKQYQVYSAIKNKEIQTVINAISLSRNKKIQDWTEFIELFDKCRGSLASKKFGF